MSTIDRSHLHDLMERERATFRDAASRSSGRLAAQAQGNLLYGVPMNWMTRWPGDHPVFVDRAEGARFRDVDGNEFVDFCLGDTGGMAGHGPKASVDAIAARPRTASRSCCPPRTPTGWRRDGTPFRRPPSGPFSPDRHRREPVRDPVGARDHRTPDKIVVHNWSYHGSVDETFASLDENGEVIAAPRNIGNPVPPAQTTRVVEFNDLEALEAALAHGDVAACLFEPALTNIGIVLPEPGYHERVRELCTKYGTLLIIDETHTISAGPGGCTTAWGLEPDFVTIGKTLGAGIPSAALRDDRARSPTAIYANPEYEYADVGGIGGTLAGNALSIAAMRATLARSSPTRPSSA